jgi:hypothetical protein
MKRIAMGSASRSPDRHRAEEAIVLAVDTPALSTFGDEVLDIGGLDLVDLA